MEMLEAVIGGLDLEERVLYQLKFQERLSEMQIAERLGVEERTGVIDKVHAMEDRVMTCFRNAIIIVERDCPDLMMLVANRPALEAMWDAKVGLHIYGPPSLTKTAWRGVRCARCYQTEAEILGGG